MRKSLKFAFAFGETSFTHSVIQLSDEQHQPSTILASLGEDTLLLHDYRQRKTEFISLIKQALEGGAQCFIYSGIALTTQVFTAEKSIRFRDGIFTRVFRQRRANRNAILLEIQIVVEFVRQYSSFETRDLFCYEEHDASYKQQNQHRDTIERCRVGIVAVSPRQSNLACYTVPRIFYSPSINRNVRLDNVREAVPSVVLRPWRGEKEKQSKASCAVLLSTRRNLSRKNR